MFIPAASLFTVCVVLSSCVLCFFLVSAVAISGFSQLLRKDIELSQSPDSGEALLQCGLSVSFPDLLLDSVDFAPQRQNVVSIMYWLPQLGQ